MGGVNSTDLVHEMVINRLNADLVRDIVSDSRNWFDKGGFGTFDYYSQNCSDIFS